ncbi:hypothetical protein [Erythrobacter sp.]|uniref:hypothetical protein n=1 Tax=Erythrobacter sp. TaxID=1042 RepID=UPI002EAC8057|nr:hypothetical protein [Erythrobacter sp.]
MQPRAEDIVLEPSAGHGMLAALQARVAELHLNEIDPKRRAKLAVLYPEAKLTSHDGAMLTSLTPSTLRPSLILMNPPFAPSKGRGVDPHAAVRHLRSAIAKSALGARIVVVMPDGFTTSAKMLSVYERTFDGCSVVTSCRLATCYRKQGTSVAVRLLVIDKRPGNIKPSVICRDTVAELCEAIEIVPRRAIVFGSGVGIGDAEARADRCARGTHGGDRAAWVFKLERLAQRERRDIGTRSDRERQFSEFAEGWPVERGEHRTGKGDWAGCGREAAVSGSVRGK